MKSCKISWIVEVLIDFHPFARNNRSEWKNVGASGASPRALLPSNGVSAYNPPQRQYPKSYTAFLGCEINEGISNLDEQPPPEVEKDDPYTFSVVNSAPFVFAARSQEVRALVAAGVAAIYDISYALRNRETCVKQVYGPGYF